MTQVINQGGRETTDVGEGGKTYEILGKETQMKDTKDTTTKNKT